MDIEFLNKYYNKLIGELNNINNKIVSLNELYNSIINLLNDTLCIDNKVFGYDEITEVKIQTNLIRDEIRNQIIPNLRSKIK